LSDLEIAKSTLNNEGATLVVVKNGRMIFKTNAPGMRGLLQAIENLKDDIHGASIADSVVGRAAGLLITYSRVKEAYAAILSEEGLKVLRENKIEYEFGRIVPWILDESQTDLCPFEKFSLGIKSPDEAYQGLKRLQESMGR
jgi:hypothetical protein